jgi:hypothetical protein
LCAFVNLAGTAVIEPRLDASVIEPFCTKTKSPSSTCMISACPLNVPFIATTLNWPSTFLWSMSVTASHATVTDQNGGGQRADATTNEVGLAC